MTESIDSIIPATSIPATSIPTTSTTSIDQTGQTAATDSSTLTEHKIRERAFQLWQEAGSPEGRAEEFWHLAQAAETKANDVPPGDTQNFA